MTIVLTKKPQFIERDGKPEYVVIAYEDYITNFREDVTIPHAVVKLSVKHDSNLIKAWRLHLGFSQQNLAQKMGISQAAYSQMEKGKNPSVDTVAKIANALGVEIGQLNIDD